MNSHLDGQKRNIEEAFRAIVWLSSEVAMPRHALNMVCGGTESDLPDVVIKREKSLVTNTRGPALPRDDQNVTSQKLRIV